MPFGSCCQFFYKRCKKKKKKAVPDFFFEAKDLLGPCLKKLFILAVSAKIFVICVSEISTAKSVDTGISCYLRFLVVNNKNLRMNKDQYYQDQCMTIRSLSLFSFVK